MAIPVAASSATTGATTTSPIAVAKPSGMASGDLWVAIVGSTGSGNTITTPSGWTQRISAVSSSGADHLRITVFDRVCDGSEGSTVDFSGALGSGPYYWAHSIRLTGVNTSAPYDTSAKVENASYVLGRSLPSVTTAGADRLLIGSLSRWYTADLDTDPSDWTVVVDNVDLHHTWRRDAATATTYTTSSFDDASDYELWASAVVAYAGAASDVTGTIAMTLDALSTSIAGTETIAGTVALTLDPVTAAVVGTETINGTIAVTLDDVATSFFDDPNVTGTIAITLADLTTGIEGTESIAGEISLTLADLTSAVEGESVFLITGSIEMTLDDLVSYVQGERRGKPRAELVPPGPVFRSAKTRRRYFRADRNPVTDP